MQTLTEVLGEGLRSPDIQLLPRRCCVGANGRPVSLPQVWQHCDCMRLETEVEHYLCEQCDPRPVERVCAL